MPGTGRCTACRAAPRRSLAFSWPHLLVAVRGRTHPCARPLDPLARANIARRLPTCQEQGRPCLCGCLDPLPPTAGSWKNPQRGRSIVTSGNSVKCRDRRGTERRSEEWVRRSAGRFARGRRLRLGAPRRSLVGRRASPAHGQPEAEPAVDLPEAAVTAAERRVRRAPAGEAHATGRGRCFDRDRELAEEGWVIEDPNASEGVVVVAWLRRLVLEAREG